MKQTPKKWLARACLGREDYGRWIPTGCSDQDEARVYMQMYHRELFVKEWLFF